MKGFKMDLLEAVKKRHAVRQYTDKIIEGDIKEDLLDIIDKCNKESGLSIQLCLDNEKIFGGGFLSRFTLFKNVQNCIAIVGKKSKDLDEKAGYYGEKIVIKATQLGLNTCWAAGGYNKSKINVEIEKDEKFVIAIAIGYGIDDGKSHKVKPIEKLGSAKGEMPHWFKKGLEAAQLAPTARNQQKFQFTLLDGNVVKADTSFGFFTKIDLGIAKYHFEIGADSKEWTWK
jgi:nitroreductase